MRVRETREAGLGGTFQLVPFDHGNLTSNWAAEWVAIPEVMCEEVAITDGDTKRRRIL